MSSIILKNFKRNMNQDSIPESPTSDGGRFFNYICYSLQYLFGSGDGRARTYIVTGLFLGFRFDK